MDLMTEARQALMRRRSRLRAQGEAEKPQGAGKFSEQDHRELRDIDDALRRMEGGEFGRCSRCGGAMGRHRLRAVPEARYCLTCSSEVAR
jgi:DnaK suppressor protein